MTFDLICICGLHIFIFNLGDLSGEVFWMQTPWKVCLSLVPKKFKNKNTSLEMRPLHDLKLVLTKSISKDIPKNAPCEMSISSRLYMTRDRGLCT